MIASNYYFYALYNIGWKRFIVYFEHYKNFDLQIEIISLVIFRIIDVLRSIPQPFFRAAKDQENDQGENYWGRWVKIYKEDHLKF